MNRFDNNIQTTQKILLWRKSTKLLVNLMNQYLWWKASLCLMNLNNKPLDNGFQPTQQIYLEPFYFKLTIKSNQNNLIRSDPFFFHLTINSTLYHALRVLDEMIHFCVSNLNNKWLLSYIQQTKIYNLNHIIMKQVLLT